MAMLRSSAQWIIVILIGLDLESGQDRMYLFLARLVTALTVAAVCFLLASFIIRRNRNNRKEPPNVGLDESVDGDRCPSDDPTTDGDSEADKSSDKSSDDHFYCSRDDPIADGESELDKSADCDVGKSADNSPSSPEDLVADGDSQTESQSKLSGNEVTPTKDKSELSSSSTPDHQSKPVPSTSTPVPPHEERSAPEGTSSPTPRPSDTSEHKPSSSRPNSIPPEGYMSTAEVQKLLKQQELQFEEKLLRAELVSGEKEKKLRQAMKDEQKEMSNLGETVTELTQSRDALLKLVGQYKGMLASLVSEKEKEKQNQEERIKTLEQERNQALEDLANVEVAFSDVHRKYERTKQVVDTLRRNEETLRGAVTDYENKLQKQEQKFIEFQKHAEEKIQLANEEFEAMRRANDQEMTKMAALLKKAEMKIMSLQDSNDRKTRENQELTQLCDDLINKVGTSH